jgi:hypothetical protein
MQYENEDLINEIESKANDFLGKKHSNCYRDNFFPTMINIMGYKTGAEIGVDKAGFSNHILNKTQIEKYFCIDTWQDDFGSDYKPDYFNKDGNIRFNQAKENLKPYLLDFDNPHLDCNRVIMIKNTSIGAANTITDNTLDFCYIDGDHSLFGIYDDIHIWAPKVKIGGIIAGHDYKDGPKSGIKDFFGNQLDYKIKTVIDNYCLKNGHKLHIIGGRILNWWFVKNR